MNKTFSEIRILPQQKKSFAKVFVGAKQDNTSKQNNTKISSSKESTIQKRRTNKILQAIYAKIAQIYLTKQYYET